MKASQWYLAILSEKRDSGKLTEERYERLIRKLIEWEIMR